LGFTLPEVLVTLVVVGLVYWTVAVGLRLGMRVHEKQHALGLDSWSLADGWQAARRALAGLDPGSHSRPGMFEAFGDRLAFTTVLPGVRQSPVDAALLVDERHRLVLRWAGGATSSERVLAEGVAGVAFAYRGSPVSPWASGWSGSRLPGLVRLSVTWTDPARRPWPAIIVRPALIVPRD
jgi:prepilin-type N-terminal cleavage/methylation domain-containing protein